MFGFLQNPWWYILFGFCSIMVFLMVTRHVSLPNANTGHAGCGDGRVDKEIFVFAGSAGFTYGWPYFFLSSMVSESLIGYYLWAYGGLQLLLSIIQTLTFLAQVVGTSSKTKTIILKAHFQGCGFTTAWGPFWPLFWFQKIPGFGWLVFLRDILTLFDYVVSLPATIIIGVFTLIFMGKLIVPVIYSVDHQH